MKGLDNLDRPVLDTNYMKIENDNCDYIDYQDGKITLDDLDLSLLHINVRGLASKVNDLSRLLQNCTNTGEVDVVFVCETWLNPFSPDVDIEGYQLIHVDRRNRRGGGVSIYINKKLSRINEIDVTCEDAECCGVELTLGSKQLVLISMYRPPNSTITNFNKSFKKMVDSYRKKNKHVIIGTDHNLDFLKADHHVHTQHFIEQTLDAKLLPMITRPTRITKTMATLIDNILIDQNIASNVDCSVLIDNISDHLPCLSVIRNLKTTPNSRLTITSRDTRKKSLAALKTALEKCDWYSDMNPDSDLNNKVQIFHDRLTEMINYHCPTTTRIVRFSQIRREPWLSAGILKSSKKCKLLYKQTLLPNCCDIKIERYKEYNRVLQRLKRVSKMNHYDTMCIKHKANTKQLWQIINRVISSTKDKTNIVTCLKVDRVKTYNPRQIAEGFGKHFASVGESFAKQIKKSKHSISDLLAKIERNPVSLFARPTDPQEVKRLIMQLPNKSSSGFDCISNIMLKEICPFIVDILSDLFNQSLNTGIFPELMKEAEVVPLFKSKSPLEVTNYRPISLLLTISKILEKIIYCRTYNFLNETNQLFVSQYGFRAKHACDHAISELLGEIVKNHQLGKHTVGIFLDLSKAFDTLEHSVVFAKLEKYGIRGTMLDWFKSYLANRSLSVKCITENSETVKSSKYMVNYGTAQGSCLGPLIFLVFCNDIRLNLTFLSCIQFADDTSLYKSHYNLQYLKFCVEHDMQSLLEWFRANKLTLNVQKSVCILFTPNGKHIQLDLKLDGLEIPQVMCTKLLGLWIDDKLRWLDHVNKLILRFKN